MIKKKQSRSRVVVDLKELEWEKVFEDPVPTELGWLGLIQALRPVQFDRSDLELLIYCIRENAVAVKPPRERASLEKIANKMARAMRLPPTGANQVPNNKQTVLKKMRQDLRKWNRKPTPDDPYQSEYIKMAKAILKCLSHKKSEGELADE
jgi:hypothetical protein